MKKIIIVAEVACAHEGNMDKLFKMIEVAGDASVDVIQFQFYQTDELMIATDKNIDLGKQLEIPLDKYKEVFEYSRKKNMGVWATVGDLISAREACKYKPQMWRIHSSDINNISLIEYICTTDIPISFAVGGSTIEEIEYAVNYTRERGGKVNALIWGFQGYPTPVDEVNLKYIELLTEKFNIAVGYQDHTDGDNPIGFIIPAMAISHGAVIIEKHFTLDRSLKGIDYHASLNPSELKIFTAQIRETAKAIGNKNKVFGKFESKYRKNFKKGFVFRTNLSKGEIIKPEHLKMVRNEKLKIYGIDINKIIGKKLKVDVNKDQITDWRLFE